MLAGVPSDRVDRDAIPWREFRYVMYAREFGWTPEQVDNLPLAVEPWILPIQSTIEADIDRRRNQAIDKAKREALKTR